MKKRLDRLIQQYPSQWKLLGEGNSDFLAHFVELLMQGHPDLVRADVIQEIMSRLLRATTIGDLHYTSRGHSILSHVFDTRQKTLKARISKMDKEQVPTAEQESERNEYVLDLSELDRLTEQL